MAQTQQMTYGQIVNQIQLQTLNDPASPASGTQEYQTYTQLIGGLAIPTWENERNVLWNELWVDQPNYNNIKIVAAQPDIQLPSDFKFMGGGFIRLTYTGSVATNPTVRSFPVKMLPEVELNPRQNLPEVYVYGNINSGFFLKFGWIPQVGASEIGATISFRYYKYAATPDLSTTSVLLNPNDIPEMSDPMYIVYKISAAVSAANFNSVLYQIQEDRANYCLKQMVTANTMASNFMDDYIKDVDALIGNRPAVPNRMNSGYWTSGIGW